ncbi:MAG: DUF1697 domain-containing protein [Gallionella sp.]
MARVSTYLNFSRNTEEAFKFYKSIFGTEFSDPIARFKDIPPQPGQPPLSEVDGNLVMHVALPVLGGHVLMGTDAPGSMGFKLNQGNNVVFQGKAVDAARLEKIVKANPFPEAEAAGNTLHFNFLAEIPPRPDLAGIEKIRASSERCALKGGVLYLHAPDGIGRSKLAANMEKLLGVTMTGRNWNTVSRLREMAATK